MAMDGDILGTDIKNAVLALTPVQKTDLEKAWQTISKEIVDHIITYGQFSVMPIGTILSWHKSFPNTPTLPAGFLECNGQVVSDAESPYDGQTLPNLNGKYQTYHSKGVFLRGDSVSGTFENDEFQDFQVGALADATGERNYYGRAKSRDRALSHQLLVNYVEIQFQTTNQGATNKLTAVDDGTNGTPRTGSETRPVNMSVVYIMKVK